MALSGGKIKTFIKSPDANPNDPSDCVLLKACRQIKGISGASRGGFVKITYHYAGQTKITATPALVIGNRVLVQPASVCRFLGMADGIGVKGSSWGLKGHRVIMATWGSFILFSGYQQFPEQYILLNPGSKFADVGGTPVKLQQPVIWIDKEKQQVMLLSDLVKLFQISDAQTGVPTITQVQIIYQLPPYKHF